MGINGDTRLSFGEMRKLIGGEDETPSGHPKRQEIVAQLDQLKVLAESGAIRAVVIVTTDWNANIRVNAVGFEALGEAVFHLDSAHHILLNQAFKK